ncbi:MAG: 2-dehydropantoate 2-reductase [Deltaproteobacteria bacterium]|nr:2-dehydropantoate 2-reductase [Deltaproteobacteria bacterium]
MKIAVFGTGAVGGYIGGRLAQAGNDVTFVARKKHLEAIKADGLQVKSISGDFLIYPARATDRPEEIGEVDMVLCCVKSWQVSEVARQMQALIGTKTVIIPIQNGVEAHTTLARTIDANHILPGLCKMICLVEAPGCIRHVGIDPYLSFGEISAPVSTRAEDVAEIFAGVQGLLVNVSQNILQELWLKFIFIAPWSGVGALTRAPVGVLRSVDETRQLLLQAIQEVYQVGRASGVDLAESAVQATIDFIDQAPPQGTASMQRDIMEGRPSEIHEQCGSVVRYGENSGVKTPVNRFIYHSLLPLEKRAREELTF